MTAERRAPEEIPDVPDSNEEVEEFSAIPTVKKIKIETSPGVKEDFTIRDVLGTEREEIMTDMANRSRLGPNGQPMGVRTFDGIHAFLITRCLYNAEGKRVDPKIVKRFPGKLQEQLYERCLKITGLDAEAADRAKKSATEGGAS